MTAPLVNVTAVNRSGDAVSSLQTDMRARKLAGLTVTGPAKSRVMVYMGAISPSTRFDQTSRGESNSADYATPRLIPPGTSVFVVWPGQGVNASQCQATFSLTD